jgi:predicted  nucleic acid-binding Zn-ribbon protein
MNPVDEEIRQLRKLGHEHAARDLEEYRKTLKKMKTEVKPMAQNIIAPDLLKQITEVVSSTVNAELKKIRDEFAAKGADLNGDGVTTDSERAVYGQMLQIYDAQIKRNEAAMAAKDKSTLITIIINVLYLVGLLFLSHFLG